MMRHAVPPRLVVGALLAFAALNATAFVLLERRATTLEEREAALVAALDDARCADDWRSDEPPQRLRIVALYVDTPRAGVRMPWSAVGRWSPGVGLTTTMHLPDGTPFDVCITTTRPKAWRIAPDLPGDDEGEVPSNPLDASPPPCYTLPFDDADVFGARRSFDE